MRHYTMMEPIYSYCAVCHERIKEKYYVVMGNKKLHSECIYCSNCNSSLSNATSCCEKDDVIYCKTCYYSLFPVTICMGCRKGISKHDLAMQAKDYFYHVNCFRCSFCQIKLEPGQRFGLRDKNLFCEGHITSKATSPTHETTPSSTDDTKLSFTNLDNNHREIKQHFQHFTQPSPSQIQVKSMIEKVQEVVGIENNNNNNNNSNKLPELININNTNTLPLQNTDNNNMNLDIQSSEISSSPRASSSTGDQEMSQNMSSGNSDSDDDNKLKPRTNGKEVKRRSRTRFNHQQLMAMKDLFDIDKNPDSTALNQLSEKIGLKKRVLQVWFQNARAKSRKGQNILGDNLERLLNPSNDS